MEDNTEIKAEESRLIHGRKMSSGAMDEEEGKQFTVENLNKEVSRSWQSTKKAGELLNLTYQKVKSVREDLKRFIENMDEQWVEKKINEWAKDRLAEDVQADIREAEKREVERFKDMQENLDI
jgi:uncharacterized coiled-coil protein SlyX